MTAERWTLVARIYDSVVDAPASERVALLDAACGDDTALRQNVESLLAQDARSSPVDEPVWDTVVRVLTPEALHLERGQRIGPYLVEDVIGRGGMGEVYRARDTNLGRAVALKVLPRAWSTDNERLARFRREAQTLATVNHPNIAIIHGFEQGGAPAVHALVMELVDGPTLAHRLGSGAIPIDEALSIARQIADALEAAHEQNIVHRDLKPANVKLRPDGTIKVLDFGLAKPVPPVSAEDPSVSPTIATPAVTVDGVILGSAAYMSPEQAKGGAADRRADIWAFGVVLYEMLTGVRPFHGEDVSDTLAAVLRGEPDWNRLPAAIPPAVRRLLKRCLTKSLRDRLQHIGDARLELAESSERVPDAPPPIRTRERVAWSIASLCALATLVAAVWVANTRSNGLSVPEMRVEIGTPPTADPVSFAISPDGRHIVFVAPALSGAPQLWMRALDAMSPQPLAGTIGARYPFWAPDSRSIGFFADGKVKRLDVATGSTETLADASAGFGGTWNRNGVILFAPAGGSPIMRVNVGGGAPRAVTTDAAQFGHRGPQFLPDGEHFLFYSGDTRGIYIGGLSSDARRLMEADAAAVCTPSGYVLYARQGRLFAQRFDMAAMDVVREPFLLADPIAVSVEAGLAALSASFVGPIVYRSGPLRTSSRRLRWVDHSGQPLGTVDPPDATPQLFHPVLSPDDRRIALWGSSGGRLDVYVLDAADGRGGPVTTEPGSNSLPIWSPDGTQIAFVSRQTGKANEIAVQSSSSPLEQHGVVSNEGIVAPLDWSRDGSLLYSKGVPGQRDLFALPLRDAEPAGPSLPVVINSHDKGSAQFSPDGKWVAYESNESGRFEIYVQPFRGPGPKTTISRHGGTQVRWGRDGRELLFVAPDDQLISVSIKGHSDGTIDVGTPTPLFTAHVSNPSGNLRQEYDVARDGRFLLNALNEPLATPPLTLLLNWQAGQK
jgi:serine/threonine protein kinase/Tol biopolymer transport system component